MVDTERRVRGKASWTHVRDDIHARGLRWTPQRRLILDVLASTAGHVTGAEIVERCRERDPATTASTVYRTLDVLEELGYLSHSHSAAGREEFHVQPRSPHAHLECRTCGATIELPKEEAAALVTPLRVRHGFAADLAHMTITGECADCATAAPVP
jgi:Fur family transcriptional regulator, ferric uptake regulator